MRLIEPATVPKADYAYLLGLYLGDGYICRAGRTYRIRIAMDSRYPRIISEARRALAGLVFPRKASVLRCRDKNMVEVYAVGLSLPTVFPQHGPGPKHARPIYLAEWQQPITDACERLGIDSAFTKTNTVSIAKAESVARLDEFVGAKS